MPACTPEDAPAREILKGISLSVPAGEVHAVMGPNGSGKSTLGYVLTGRDGYEVTSGEAKFEGEDLLSARSGRAGGEGPLPVVPVSAGDRRRAGDDVRARGDECAAQGARRA